MTKLKSIFLFFVRKTDERIRAKKKLEMKQFIDFFLGTDSIMGFTAVDVI